MFRPFSYCFYGVYSLNLKLTKLLIITVLFVLVPSFTHSDDYFIAKRDCDFLPSSDQPKRKTFVDFSYKVSKVRNNIVDIYLDGEILSINKSCGILTAFAPFFSGVSVFSNLPAEPVLDVFDKRILQACGKLGDEVSADTILSVLDQDSFLHILYENFDNSIEDGKTETFANFRTKVLDIWVKSDGFRRIFCGLVNENGLQGLNYIGRYVNAYSNGWIGYDNSCSKNDIWHSIYAFGVFYVNKDGKIQRECPLTSFYTLSAKELFTEAMYAYKKFSQSTGTCIHYITYNDDDVYAAAFTKRDNSIFAFEANVKNSCNSGDCECK